VLFPLELVGITGKKAEDRVKELLDYMEIAHRSRFLPAFLSGGEQQRVCIARALVNEPEIILADEPTGNLDEANEEKVLEIFHRLHKEGKTIIVVTHDREMGQQAQRVVMMQHGRITCG